MNIFIKSIDIMHKELTCHVFLQFLLLLHLVLQFVWLRLVLEPQSKKEDKFNSLLLGAGKRILFEVERLYLMLKSVNECGNLHGKIFWW